MNAFAPTAAVCWSGPVYRGYAHLSASFLLSMTITIHSVSLPFSPLILGSYNCVCHLLACLRSSALTPFGLRQWQRQRGSRERTMYAQNFPDDRSRACKRGWAVGRGNAMCEGQEWCHKQRQHHQERSAAFCRPSRACVAPLRADGKLTVKLLAFRRRSPSFSGHFCTHGGLHSCAVCQLSEHHSDHHAAACTIYVYRPPQMLPYLSDLLQQAIPHRVAARRHPLKQ